MMAASSSILSSTIRCFATVPATPLKTVIVVGSTRSKRIGSTVSDYLVSQLEERGGHEVTVLDPRTTHDGFFMRLMEKAYFHYKKDETPPHALAETAAVLRAADAYIVCTPEMNHTIAPGVRPSYFTCVATCLLDTCPGYSAGLGLTRWPTSSSLCITRMHCTR
jgi:hypothetical protein